MRRTVNGYALRGLNFCKSVDKLIEAACECFMEHSLGLRDERDFLAHVGAPYASSIYLVMQCLFAIVHSPFIRPFGAPILPP